MKSKIIYFICQSVHVESELAFFISNYEIKIMMEKMVENQIGNLTLNHLKSKNKNKIIFNKKTCDTMLKKSCRWLQLCN
jgi:hypothetical protein